MEFKVQTAGKMPAIEWNYSELKNELNEQLKKYRHLVYTEDNIKTAKEDRARLNKLVRAINDQKLVVKENYCREYFKFEDQVKELQQMVKDQNEYIDKAIKTFEEKERDEKRKQIEAVYLEEIAEFESDIPLEKLFADRWLNKTVTLKEIRDYIKTKVIDARESIAYIDRIETPFTLEMKKIYFDTLSLVTALERNKQLQELKAKREEKPKVIEKEPEEKYYVVTMQINVTDKLLDQLTDFLDENGMVWFI